MGKDDIYLFMVHSKKEPPNKTPTLRKSLIWAFESLVDQINSLYEVSKLKQNLRKNKLVTSKTLLFALCTHHSICLNIGF